MDGARYRRRCPGHRPTSTQHWSRGVLVVLGPVRVKSHHSFGQNTAAANDSSRPNPAFEATLGHRGLRAYGGSSPIHPIQQAQAFPGWITQEHSEIDPAVVSVHFDCAEERRGGLGGGALGREVRSARSGTPRIGRVRSGHGGASMTGCDRLQSPARCARPGRRYHRFLASSAWQGRPCRLEPLGIPSPRERV